ncbi:hypothetical protein [Paraburkholderia caballeronis]|uniref:Methyltransferase domain-containing protein n=1 Tax=Paraburkholderia caballeronis TaxID=416943 RepID=A0A1H7VEJ2_9BURK|nr:hypothetical protein [Paraburkholderia caballeronis]PXW16937.1 hypothetical protein C7403_12069 [Paraburkholderia caballeronis]PXW94615.1 hypothetical protein C7407_12011 [Paraburkholderia caballeronis]RAJ89994.1 hypothetical protein C7409_12069 [Paraburkholderia caballeronis]SEB58377.1 hypothetical protein SAMN05445871_0637 [Paraburkholderia caballeronis]SEM07672.1 hypothetical protein SAMN05192542_12452 [Paraburkholderia caballeronis]
MGMHPKFEREDSFLLADMVLGADKLDVLKQLIDRKLVSVENVEAWGRLLAALQVDSTGWFKMIDHLKVRIDPLIGSGGYISEKSPYDIVGNYKAAALGFDANFFSHANFSGKTALDFGAGVYRPFCVAVMLFANGFDRVYSFEPFALKPDFPLASLMHLVNQMLVQPERFDFSGIGEDALLQRVRSLDLRHIDRSLAAVANNETDVIDLGGVLFTSNIDRIPDGAIDAHFSNAVLEHVQDMARHSSILRRVTSATSVGYHIVDFLDHRYYDDNNLSPFEKYYDGVLDEINGLTPSDLERVFLQDEWSVGKITWKTVPAEYFERETRPVIDRYAGYSRTELEQHLNCYQFRKDNA